MTKQQFEEITKWQNETFGKFSPQAALAHLEEELDELNYDLYHNIETRNMEWADCFILLFGAAKRDGLSYEDICNAINSKMDINYKRNWGVTEENGVIHHIEE